MPAIEAQDDYVVLRLRVQPKAARNAFGPSRDDFIKVSLTAPPVDGKANAALCRFISETLGVPKRNVSLTAGERSREKTVRVEGLSIEDVRAKMPAPRTD